MPAASVSLKVWKGNKETVKADEGEAAIDCTEGHVNQSEPMWTNRDLLSCAFFLYTCTLECTVRACTTTPFLFGNCTWMHLGCPLEVFVFFYWLHHWWWCTYVHKLECLLTSVIRLVPSQPLEADTVLPFYPNKEKLWRGIGIITLHSRQPPKESDQQPSISSELFEISKINLRVRQERQDFGRISTQARVCHFQFASDCPESLDQRARAWLT